MNRKLWRLMRSWYTGAVCRVKSDSGQLSIMGRGVKQGSVLSPTLFLLVMDPFAYTSGLGLSVNDFYAGCFLHADDIRTLAASTDTLSAKVNVVKEFADEIVSTEM